MTAIADELMRAKAQARHVDPSVASDPALTVSAGYEVAAQAIADFGLHAALLIGKRVSVGDLRDVQAVLRDFRVTLFEDGSERDRGGGASVLGSPLSALSHLVELLAAAPQSPPLRSGELVTTGTLTAAWPVTPGQTWRTEIEGISLEGLEIDFT